MGLYAALTVQSVEDLIPDKVPLFMIRIVTKEGVIVMTYHVNLEPMFFQHGKTLVPSGKGIFSNLVAHSSVCVGGFIF